METLESRCLLALDFDPLGGATVYRPVTLDPALLADPTTAGERIEFYVADVAAGDPRLNVEPGEVFLLSTAPPPSQLALRTPENEDAADTVNADQLYPGGDLGLNLTGSGLALGVWDEGTVRDTHREFAIAGGGSRIVAGDTGGTYGDHATHVAGTIGASGVTTAARGMANAVTIRSYTWTDDLAEMRSDANLIVASNHSYGDTSGWSVVDTGDRSRYSFLPDVGVYDVWFADRSLGREDADFGKYTARVSDLDDVLFDHPQLLSVWSAGNDRNDEFTNYAGTDDYVAYLSADPGNVTGYTVRGYYVVPDSGPTAAPGGDGNDGAGYDSLSSPGSAKNSLVVGAVGDVTDDPYTAADVSMTDFSNHGPTDDGRIKPDVVANGVGVYSSTAQSDSDYGSFDGTSMAAPGVTGTVALLTEHYEDIFGGRPRAATTKGLLIHTAFDAGNAGPDFQFGWGLVDAAAAARLITKTDSVEPFSSVVERAYAGAEWTMEFQARAGAPLKVTLVWTDPAGAAHGDGLDETTSVLEHDLDLWITGPDSTRYHPWTLNPAHPDQAAVQTQANHVDNVEQVLIAAPQTGAYTIHVGHTGGSFTQDYSLIVSNYAVAERAAFGHLTQTYESSGGHFRVHYTDDLSDPDHVSAGYASDLAAALETSWSCLVGTDAFHFDAPPGDGEAGGGQDLLDAYIVRPGHPALDYAMGRTFPDVGDPVPPFVAISAGLDPADLKTTAAHEFFHCIQRSYGEPSPFLREGSAVFVSDAVFDDINDYRYYVNQFFVYPDMSLVGLTTREDVDDFYWQSLYWKFVAEQYGTDGAGHAAFEDPNPNKIGYDPNGLDVLKQLMLQTRDHPGLEAIEAALAAYGTTFRQSRLDWLKASYLKDLGDRFHSGGRMWDYLEDETGSGYMTVFESSPKWQVPASGEFSEQISGKEMEWYASNYWALELNEEVGQVTIDFDGEEDTDICPDRFEELMVLCLGDSDQDGNADAVLAEYHYPLNQLNARQVQIANAGYAEIGIIIVSGSSDAWYDMSISSGPPVNHAPTSYDTPDAATSQNRDADILLQAADPDGDALLYIVTEAPRYGNLRDAAGNILTPPQTLPPGPPQVTYDPQLDFFGVDHFHFQVRDEHGLDSAVATVTITVATFNYPPVAYDVAVNASAGAVRRITLDGWDANQEPLTYQITQLPSSGTAVLRDPLNGRTLAAGDTLSSHGANVDYTADPDFRGEDVFRYRALDAAGSSHNVAKVTVTVRPGNHAPIADDIGYATQIGTPLRFTLPAHDSDWGDRLTYTVRSLPRGRLENPVGHVTIQTVPYTLPYHDCELIYTPTGGVPSVDSLTFQVSDGQENSNVATVTLRVDPAPQQNIWPVQVVDPTPNPSGLSAGMTYGGPGLHANGHPAVTYVVNHELRYAEWNPLIGWDIRPVDTGCDVDFTSLAFNFAQVWDDPWNYQDGTPAVAYRGQDFNQGGSGDLRYAYRDAQGIWHPQSVDADEHSAGYGASLQITDENRPVIAYFVLKGGDLDELRVAFGSDIAGSSWVISTADVGDFDEYGRAALYIDGSERPHIVYHASNLPGSPNEGLKYAFLPNHSGGWQVELLRAGDGLRFPEFADIEGPPTPTEEHAALVYNDRDSVDGYMGVVYQQFMSVEDATGAAWEAPRNQVLTRTAADVRPDVLRGRITHDGYAQLGQPAMVYARREYGESEDKLHYDYRDGAGVWHRTVVGLDAVGDQFRDVALSFTSDGWPRIALRAADGVKMAMPFTTLTVSVDPPEAGTVTRDVAQDQYWGVVPVQVAAVPSVGWTFSHWTGDVPAGLEAQPQLTVFTDRPRALVAHFEQRITLDWSVSSPGAGDVTYVPDKEYFNADGSELVQVQARPAGDYLFSGWSGDVPEDLRTQNPVTVSMDRSRRIVANFAPPPALTVEVGGPYAIEPGQTIEVPLQINSPDGYTGFVYVVAPDLPPGLTASAEPDYVPYSGTLRLAASPDYEPVARDLAFGVQGERSTKGFTVRLRKSETFPRVLGESPVNGGPHVHPNTPIKIYFDRAMDPATLNGSTITVTGSVSGEHACAFSYDAATMTLTLDPAADFAAGEDVAVRVTAGARGADGTRLLAEYQWTFHVHVEREDEVRLTPQVLGSSPVDGGPRLAATTNITVWFNTAIDVLTLDDTTILVQGSASGRHRGNVVYDSVAKTATFDPFVDFTLGEDVTVTVTTGVYSLDGLPLPVEYGFTFHVIPPAVPDDPLPASRVVAVSPPHGAPRVDPGMDLGVTFSMPVDQDTLGTPRILIQGSVSGPHAYDYYYDPNTRTCTVTPAVDFTLGEDVTVTVTTGVLDLNGDPIAAPYSFTYHVRPAEVPVMYTDIPHVVGTSPVSGGPMLSCSTNIEVWFDTAMNSATFINTTITVVGSASGLHTTAFLYDASSLKMTINPNVDFTLGEQVTVTLTSGVKDDEGDPLPADYVFSFRTIPATTSPTPVAAQTITGTATWSAANSPYLVNGNITVAATGTLTIEPGVVVKMGSATWLNVQGLLNVQATAENRVVFTSYRDDQYGGDSNGDGASSGSRGDWYYLALNNSANTFAQALLRYGGRSSNGSLIIGNSNAASPVVRNTVIEESLARGIWVYNGTPLIEDSVLRAGGSDGIYLETAAAMRRNAILNFGAWGIAAASANPSSIEQNTVLNCVNGIYSNSYGSTITGNTISGCSDTAIKTDGGAVTNNTVTDCVYALYQGVDADPTYSGNVFANITNHAIQVGGSLNADFVWEDVQGLGWAYRVRDGLTVPAGRKLTVPAGMVVKFNDGLYASVAGILDLQATAENRVVFTSYRDDQYGGDSNGDGVSSGSRGDWYYVALNNSANTFAQALLRYGGRGSGSLLIGNAGAVSPVVRDMVIEETQLRAIWVYDGAPLIEDSVLRAGGTDGIYLEGTATIRRNAILNFGAWAIAASSASPSWIEENTVLHAVNGVYSSSNNSTITNNTISGCSDTAIKTDGGAVTNNTITDCVYALYQGADADPTYSGNVFANITNHAIQVGGSLNADFVWEDVQGLGWAYRVRDSLTVPAGRKLTVPAGMVVKFNDGLYASVAGILDLQATAESRVVFTSYRDDQYGGDANGDGVSSGSRGDWYYIALNNSANTFALALLRYGGRGSGTLLIGNAGAVSPVVRDTVIEETQLRAIWVYNGAPLIEDSVLRAGGTDGIYLEGTATIRRNAILNCGAWAIAAASASPSWIEQNIVLTCPNGIFSSSNNGTITGNTISGCSDTAIKTDGGVVTNNTVTDCAYALYQGVDADPTYSGNVFADITNHAIQVGGSLNADFVWEDVQGLGWSYRIRDNLTVPAGRKLTIAAGTVVKFNAENLANVAGILDLQGTSENRVVFTSYRDDQYGGDTNGDGPSSGSRGDWYYLTLNNSANTFAHALVRYGGKSTSYASLTIGSAGAVSPAIRDTVIEESQYRGVTVFNGAPLIENNTVRQGGAEGIFVDDAASILGNVIFGQNWGIYSNTSTATIRENAVVRCTDTGIRTSGGTVTDNAIRLNQYPVYQTGSDVTYSGNVFADNTYPVIAVGGTISGDTHWIDVQGLHMPYLIRDNLTVAANKKLQIDGGVAVKFASSRLLRVDGTLETLGSPSNLTVFTSYRDDQYGGDSDSNGTTAGVRGDWRDIDFYSSSSVLTGTLIKYGGGSSVGQAVHMLSGASPRLENCIIAESAGRGVRAESSYALLNGCEVYNNADVGVWAASAQLNNNRIFNNALGGVQFEGGTTGVLRMVNNLIYRNGTDKSAVRIKGGSQAALANNTIFEPTSRGIWISDAAKNITLRSNLVWAVDDYNVYVTDDSRSGFASNYNDYVPGGGTAAYVGYWGANRKTLADWQTASGLDANSRSADPLFMDLDGADNAAGTADDNYHLSAGSPAIDAALWIGVPAPDREGLPRYDDFGTANSGSGTLDYVDMGSDEFQGDSSDVTPPIVTDVPTLPPEGLHTTGDFTAIVAEFSEPLDHLTAWGSANYDLRHDGADNLFDTPDDVLITLAPQYLIGSTTLTLTLPNGRLAPEHYRLTLRGTDGLRDLAGNRLDGNADGIGGDNYVRTFTVVTSLSLTIDDVSLPEGNSGSTPAVFHVRLSGASPFPVRVDYATVAQTATADTDYQTTSGTLQFDVGDLEKTVSVPVFGDAAVETAETFLVQLSNPVSAILADDRGLGTILDDDSPGAIRGRVWDDTNGDRVHDTGEPGLADWTVYLDLDHSGSRETGEPSATSQADGSYTLPNVPVGSYPVAIEVQANWLQTHPIGGTHGVTVDPSEIVTDVDFGVQRIPDLVGIQLQFTNTSGTPIDHVYLGDTFRIVVSAQDLRTSGGGVGVFSAFADLVYDTALIDAASIVHLAPFTAFQSGSINDAAGLVDEGGGATGGTPPANRNPQSVFYVQAVARQAGLLTVTTEASEAPTSENVLYGLDGDLRTRTTYAAAQLPIFGDPDLVAVAFDAAPDHVLAGQTSVTYTLKNQGTGPAGGFTVAVVYSDDDQIGNGDDEVVASKSYAGLALGQTLTDTLSVQLPVAVLNARALANDPPGLGNGHVSTSADHVGLVVDSTNSVAEENETNNANLGLGIDKDHITYFPWDIDSNGTVTPTDAMFLINRMGQTVPPADPRADLDGSGWVTPTDAIAALNRLGYVRNAGVLTPKGGSKLGGKGDGGADVVEVQMELIDDWDPAPGIMVGERFQVQLRFVDVRDPADPQSVFSGFADILFDPAFVRVDGIDYDADFPHLRLGTIDNVAGLIDELGAVDGLTPPAESQVLTLHLTALAAGSTTIQSEAADSLVAQTVVFGDETDRRSHTRHATLNLNINEDTKTLIVTRFLPTGTGFIARFNRDLDPSVLNLYDSATQTLGPADVSVMGAIVGAVRGSLLVSADRRQVTFVQTGELLEPDRYTVTLFSGATRFREPTGATLDGNADGTAGDDYQTTFTVSALPAGTVTVSVPDIARGAGQAVNVPARTAGLPLRLDNAAGVTSLAVDVSYDATLLEINGAVLAAGVPSDWTVGLDTATAGVAKVTASGTTALLGTNVDVVRLTAAVPDAAPYGAIQAVRLENVVLNGGEIEAVGDVAVHKAVYLGDVDGSGIHSSADAFLTVQAALGLASGFAAHSWTDPLIVGDADGSGVLSAADAFLIVQEGLGLSEPFVPDNPHITVTLVGGGVDPQFQIDVNLPASVGGLVTVPVKLAIEPAATNVGAFDFDLFFDPSRLTVHMPGGVSAGTDTAGWAVSAILIAPGQLRVGMVSSNGQPLAVGLREIARLQFRVGPGGMGLRPVRDGLATRPTLLPAISDHRLPITDASDGSEAHPTWLDIEPVDPRAEGYTWTDADGSVLIRPAVRAPAGARRERVWRDMDAKAELLDSVLTDLVHDVASAWR